MNLNNLIAYSQRPTPWNGTFNEKALPVASYYFIIEFEAVLSDEIKMIAVIID